MRPNIQISHQLNGRVKDYAAEHDLNLDEAYREIIQTGLAELQADGHPDIPDTQTHGQEDTTDDGQQDTESERPYDSLEFPSTVERDEAIDAIDAAADYLQQQGSASMREIVAAVMPEHSLGYDVDAALKKLEEPGERYRGAYWRRIIKPGLEKNQNIESPPRGKSHWSWEGRENED